MVGEERLFLVFEVNDTKRDRKNDQARQSKSSQGLTFRHRKAEMWGEEGVNYITWTGSWELSESGGWWWWLGPLHPLPKNPLLRNSSKANPGNRRRWKRGAGPFRTKLETEDGVVLWSPPMKQ